MALLARDADGLDRAVAEINARGGGRAYGLVADLAQTEIMASAIDAAEDHLGGAIDILLNNSGGPPPSGASGVDAALWTAQFDAMVLSLFRVTDRLLPAMRARRWGRILTIASTTVIEPNPVLGISNTLRSAVVAWSKTLAGEVAPDGVTVNLLLPGQIATDRTASLDAAAAKREGVAVELVAERKATAIPVGRYGTPAEFGAVAAFLASEHAAYVTGSMVRVDGGVVRAV